MSEQNFNYAVGSIVRARGREWIVQPNPENAALRLRPLSGTAREECLILPDLEAETPTPASFDLPNPALAGSSAKAALLMGAMQLKLRNGAGPFRSFGNIAVEPRAYQLVPLLLALRQETIRLLVADDVGVGKTIEAGLILRELIDRGEITRAAILTPPHLVEQWVSELRAKFNITAVALTASSAARLEKNLHANESLFEHYPFVVISLDYIKSEAHRDNFLVIAPDCVIVDEAHTCTNLGAGTQKRFELLKKLAENSARHMIFLTATPHSGNEAGFFNLLSLLNPEFAALQNGEDKALREKLAEAFVQRRRADIEEWKDETSFPKRETSEVTYKLTGEWDDFLEAIRDYCAGIAENRAGDRLIWYSTLALLRCSASSPEAALRALTARMNNASAEDEDAIDIARVSDDVSDESLGSDLEPELPPSRSEKTKLAALIATAEKLRRKNDDPKLLKLKEVLASILKDGYSPVVFCRYIATANYVKEALKAMFPKYDVSSVTGEMPSEAREEEVLRLAESEKRILVCTDCLSEGINLQSAFDAVVHYDLAWNPTRHEQREGRIDRYGQTRATVRSVMLYGQDNPVDGFVLKVILGKAQKIRRELGVSVPVPLDDERVSQAMIKAFLLKKHNKKANQLELALDYGDSDAGKELETLEIEWTNALEKNSRTRTVFAQHSLHPEEVLPEWTKTVGILGGASDVERFVRSACAELNIPLGEAGNALAFTPQHLDAALRSRLEEAHVRTDKTMRISFNPKALARTEFVYRSHPLVAALADFVFESALDSAVAKPLASRSAVTVCASVEEATTALLLRLRHKLSQKVQGRTSELVAEETCAVAFTLEGAVRELTADEARKLLAATPSGNLSDAAVSETLRGAFERIRKETPALEALARSRAEALLADHRRVRDAAGARGSYSVSPILPVDVIGVYVLLPDEI